MTRLHSLSDNLRENVDLLDEPIQLELVEVQATPSFEASVKKPISEQSRELRAAIDGRLAELENEMRALIDYDIAVTGKTQGIYRKFCLNYSWLTQLNVEARKVCDIERQSLVESIEDKSRIRDWILNLITANTAKIGIKLRAIFSDNAFENYSLSEAVKELAAFFDLYRFQDFEAIEEEDEIEENVPLKDDKDIRRNREDDEETNAAEARTVAKKKLKLYQVVGSVYEHIMAQDFQMQDIHLVTANQMYNEDIKFKVNK